MIFVMIRTRCRVCLRFSEASDMVLPYEKVAPFYVVGIVGTSMSVGADFCKPALQKHRRQNSRAYARRFLQHHLYPASALAADGRNLLARVFRPGFF
jgi:hypothetical protein